MSPLTIQVPGDDVLALEHLVLDVNGTLTDRGRLIDGVEDRLCALARRLSIHVATADTFGGDAAVAAQLGAELHRIDNGDDKQRLVERLGRRPPCDRQRPQRHRDAECSGARGRRHWSRGSKLGDATRRGSRPGSILQALGMLHEPLVIQDTLRP